MAAFLDRRAQHLRTAADDRSTWLEEDKTVPISARFRSLNQTRS